MITLDTGATITLRTHTPNDTLPKLSKTPLIIVCPGGGYHEHSNKEAEVVGDRFYPEGFAYCVLRYRINEQVAYPNSLVDLLKTVDYVKRNSTSLNIDPDKIIICGFSAGGHVVSSYATQFKNQEILKIANLQNINLEVSGIILGYPVITTDWMKKALVDNLIDKLIVNNPLYLDYLDTSENVKDYSPKTFIFHAQDDDVVPASDSLKYASALQAQKITYALHIYEHEGHGVGLADNIVFDNNPAISTWLNLALKFISEQCFK